MHESRLFDEGRFELGNVQLMAKFSAKGLIPPFDLKAMSFSTLLVDTWVEFCQF